MLREQNGDPHKSQTYPLYEHIWGYKQDKAKRYCTMPLPRCMLPGQDPCQVVLSQQVGPGGTCHHSRTGTAIKVAGTEDHLTRPDSENTSEPPEQVNRPHDQPELKKQRQWSHNQNKEAMYCYYMAIKDKPRGYWRRMHQQWKDRGNIKCTEQWLCDQKKQIEDKTLLKPAE